jgi:protein-tyrosine phosphatase
MNVLFVCLGNICRSPLAEELFRQHIINLNLQDKFKIDSCGTGNWHAGELADSRTRDTASINGIHLIHRARQLTLKDFTNFEYIFAMDDQNLIDIKKVNSTKHSNIQLITNYSEENKGKSIPDPYFGDKEGFIHVHQLLNQVTYDLAQYFYKQYR